MIRAVDEGNFFRIISDDRDLNYDKYFSKGNKLSEEKFVLRSFFNSNRLIDNFTNIFIMRNYNYCFYFF